MIQSSHVFASTMKHTMKDCWRTTPNASFCTVRFSLIRFECGSVQTNSASISLTCFRPIVLRSGEKRTLNLFQTEGEQLLRFRRSFRPWRTQKSENVTRHTYDAPATSATLEDDNLSRNAFRDIDLGADAVDTHVGLVRLDWRRTDTTQSAVLSNPFVHEIECTGYISDASELSIGFSMVGF